MDNGPQFVSEELESFLRRNGVRHIHTSPYHPASNGAAERLVQTACTDYLSTTLPSHPSGHNWCSAQSADGRQSSSYPTGSNSARCWKVSEKLTGPPEDTAQPSQSRARVCTSTTGVGSQYVRRPSLGSWSYCWNTRSGVLPSTSGQQNCVVPTRRPRSRWHTIPIPYISWKAGE